MDRTLDRDCAVTASESCEGGVSDGKYSDVVGGKRDLSAPNSSSTRTLRTDWLHTTITDNSSIDSLDSLVPAQQPSYAAPRPSPPSPSVSNDSGSASARPASSEPEEQPASQETFYGFIKDAIDALLVIEACLKGLLSPFKSGSDASGQLAIRSGTVIVFAESSTQMKRWRDGERWSPSRAHGPFLLYG
ncbi:Gti1/Pac2 family-domain-containing protein [Chytriomyces cf. hyalinus JEL632]|nr:Gti1/Pac2 family-domain-containing protein [Chytriomyces cf. hyalinus JEL632]